MTIHLTSKVSVLAVALVLAVPTLAQDQSEEPPVVELEEVEVVAPPIIEGDRVDRYAGQKTVVSKEQIKALNAQDLSTTLRTTPGVNISRYNVIGSFGGGSGGAVFIRGLGSSRPGGEIQTAIDGIPIYNSVWNHPLLDLVPVAPASSIEVLKGAQPATFGNSFGMVNIVPKRQTTEGFTTRITGAYGSHTTFIETAEHGGKTGPFDYYLSQAYRSSEGHRDDSCGRLTDYMARLGYELSEHWDVTALFLRTDNYAEDPGPRGQPQLKQGDYETNSWLTTVTATHHYDKLDGTIKAYWNTGEGDWRKQAGNADNTLNNWDLYGVRGTEALHLWDGGEVLLGTDLDYIEGDAKFTFDDGSPEQKFDGPRFYLVSPNAAVSHLFGDGDGWHVTPSGGVRYYDHSDFDSEWSPHAGAVGGYKRTELHASYARGYNYPGLNVVVLSNSVIPALGRSWESLEAEQVDHYELGITHAFDDKATVTVTYFYDDGKDRYVVIPPPPPPPVFSNIEEFTTQGVETTLTANPHDRVSVFGGVTYLDPDPNDLPYAPRWTVTGGVNWRFLKGFAVSLDAQYVDDMSVGAQARTKSAVNASDVDSYFLLNAKVSYAFDIGDTGLGGEIFVAGENLTDADYEYLPRYPMPGISGMVGGSITF